MAFRIRSSFFLFPFFFPPQQRRTREVKKQWAYDPNPPPSFRSSTESLFAPLSPFFLSCPLLFAVSCPPPFPLSLFASFIPASSLAHHPSLIEFLCTPVARVSSRLASPRLPRLVSRVSCKGTMQLGDALWLGLGRRQADTDHHRRISPRDVSFPLPAQILSNIYFRYVLVKIVVLMVIWCNIVI